jgi:hypothetical protein
MSPCTTIPISSIEGQIRQQFDDNVLFKKPFHSLLRPLSTLHLQTTTNRRISSKLQTSPRNSKPTKINRWLTAGRRHVRIAELGCDLIDDTEIERRPCFLFFAKRPRLRRKEKMLCVLIVYESCVRSLSEPSVGNLIAKRNCLSKYNRSEGIRKILSQTCKTCARHASRRAKQTTQYLDDSVAQSMKNTILPRLSAFFLLLAVQVR